MKMFQEIYLGSSPADEDCVQVDSMNNTYYRKMKKEILLYREQLLRMFPIPEHLLDSVKYGISRESHDFGDYLALVIKYDDDIPEAVEYAFMIESNEPNEWDKEARALLLGKQPNGTEKVLTKEDAYKFANEIVNGDSIKYGFDFCWDELPDRNSLWDYIYDGMTEKQITVQARIAMEDRLQESMDELGY